mgnify:CR=1 FL=1
MIRTNKRYPASVKAAAVRRYVTTEHSYAEVADEIGASIWAVRSWVHAASRAGAKVEESAMKSRPDDRSPEEKLELLLKAAARGEEELGVFLRENGLHDGDLKRLNVDVTSGLGRAVGTRGQSRRVQALERENRRQAKRLREAEALLELQKKLQALWADEDDDMETD